MGTTSAEIRAAAPVPVMSVSDGDDASDDNYGRGGGRRGERTSAARGSRSSRWMRRRGIMMAMTAMIKMMTKRNMVREGGTRSVRDDPDPADDSDGQATALGAG